MQCFPPIKHSDPQEALFEYQDPVIHIFFYTLTRDGVQLCFSALTWNFLRFRSDSRATSGLVLLQSLKPWCHPGKGEAKYLKIKRKNQWIEANNLLDIIIVHCPTAMRCAEPDFNYLTHILPVMLLFYICLSA